MRQRYDQQISATFGRTRNPAVKNDHPLDPTKTKPATHTKHQADSRHHDQREKKGHSHYMRRLNKKISEESETDGRRGKRIILKTKSGQN